ncbi:hypothetical protein QWC_17107 [Achromobacter marplatensis]|nr:hypothetical protein QWC_17107 [Achromobacter marplatensis]
MPSFGGFHCSHYQTVKHAELLLGKFGVIRPGVLGKYDMWPRYQASSSAGRLTMSQATRRCPMWMT